MVRLIAALILGALILEPAFAAAQDTTPFPDFHEDSVPSGWTGPVFKLSQDYPTTKPAAGTLPWKSIDFKTKPADYLKAVLNYCYEGNIDVDWVGQDNTVRKWYHAPWLHAGNKGREFIHGMTRERTTPARRLHPNQSSQFGAYAVGLYNPLGGYTIGRVWKDHSNPDASKAIFPEGSVACKLLFTQATVAQVPYLNGTVEWQANAGASFSSTTRSPKTVRLLQIDVAVKDSRAAATTGWVFGTFNYNGNAPGARPWDRMVPVGLMWGNDPTLTPAQYRANKRPAQSLIIAPNVMANPATDWKGVGWLGRLNGPIDNPTSACLSCHMTAEWPRPSTTPMFLSTLSFADVTSNDPLDPAVVAKKMRWFRNIQRQPFDAGNQSLDYSLQLHDGIDNFCAAEGCNDR
jgi:hypothetical protein